MKKIFTFLFALIFGMTMINAQTIKNDGVFSHMYIGINGGVNQTTVTDYSNWGNGFTNGLKTLTYNAGIELGKDVTPITGFSLQANVSPIYHNVANTNGSGEWKINRSDVFGNVKFNLMNLFGGYKGYPRRVEIRYVSGIGWNHDFNAESVNPNDIALQAGLEFDFNLGKNRNWYITFSPMVQANEILFQSTQISEAAKNADLKANVGIAYRFGRGNKSHNFTVCPYTYTDEQYAELYNMYDECMNRPAQIDTVVIENTVTDVIVKYNDLSNAIVVFPKNSSELNEAEIHRLDIIMNGLDKDCEYIVIGSADSATGNEEINNRLSNERANVVKELMNKNGFNNVITDTKIDVLKDQDITRCSIVRVK